MTGLAARGAGASGTGRTPSETSAHVPRAESEHELAESKFLPRRIAVEEFVQDGECLVYHPSRDEASALNRTATEVWLLCDGLLTFSGIAGVLAERYAVNEAMLLDDVARVLVALRARGLIELLPGSQL
jgi:hypothetical protein